MEKPFVHLHNHSDYSLLDGASKIEAMVRLTAEKGMPAIALTDHGNLFGAIEFYKTATRGVEIETGGQTRLVKIKPILGMEAYLTGGSMESRQAKGPGEYNHLTLLSENDEGFRNLTVLSSLGYTRGFYYKPRIDMEALGKYRSGLIALSGCVRGPVADLIFRGKPDKAREAASGLLDLFGPDNFFIEIMDHGLDIERQVLPELIKIARELGIPLVATNDCHYLNREDFEAQDALVCIGRNQQLDDPKRQRIETRELYLKSPEEMYATFPDHPEAVARTLEIAERCNVQFEFGKNHLPAFPLPDGYTEVQLLDELARKGARDRYGPERKEIEDRLRYELDIIENAGYAGYFLIVSDFVDYARQHDIPVGPGRGSAAGSIVSYCLGITDIDPLEYDLLFERFLNPERVEMPDIDIDFSDRGREEVYRYVKQKYGEGNVTQVITFGTMAARAVVKDVGRVLGLPYGEVENFAKLIPEDHGITLEEALRKRPELTEKAASNSTFGKLMRISKVLEGVHRHASTHAAAVVIAPGELTNYVPLFRSPRTEDITTQYDMKCVESMGLLKMDFLGLRTLTVIQDTLRMIEQSTDGKPDLDSLEFDDPAAFEIFRHGETVGIFQFESPGMREYLRKLKPSRIDDIIAMNALYRPGPLDANMVNFFIDRKQGKTEVSYPHPMLESILKDTYGVIVFQEQVMEIAVAMAGFTLGQADKLRKAMGKKDKEVMERQEEMFLAGTAKRGVDPKVAKTVCEMIVKFARYGFNKSHSAAYSVLAYRTAWLKAHYPRQFMASTLTSEMNKKDRLAVLLEECRRMNIKVLTPDVNESGPSFTVVEEGIRFGLAAIKNVGEGAAEAIENTRREGGRFTCLGDFLDRLETKSVNRRLAESLIRSGAMNSLEGDPEAMLATLDQTMEFCARRAEERASGQISLFGESSGTEAGQSASHTYPPLMEDYPKRDYNELLEDEKEYLGFYISGHPLDRYNEELSAFCSATSADFIEQDPRQETLRLGGIISQVRTYFSKQDREFAIISLDDRYGSLDIFIFPEAYERHRDIVFEGSFVLVSSRLNRKPEEQRGRLSADWLIALNQVRTDEGVGVEIHLDPAKTDEKQLRLMQETILRHHGSNPVYLKVVEANGAYVLRSREVFADPSDELIESLRKQLGQDKVGLSYHSAAGAKTMDGLDIGGMHKLIYGAPNGGRRNSGRKYKR